MRAAGVVVRRRQEPRSYDVHVDGHGIMRRNRAFLRPIRRAANQDDDADLDDFGDRGGAALNHQEQGDVNSDAEAPPLRRSARAARKPDRLIEVCLVRNAKDSS
ncbi:putative G-protein coupled receptor 149 [Frankliniella fusca]|uniref:G-protein coupled receptor 149 n=1 Tax=Frankliniella fusca TaxID=407009 RepID=A0AAE1L6H9_9NEOP|nr:putative G-protein coupled receptor 149 [Frankliniella fusca]